MMEEVSLSDNGGHIQRSIWFIISHMPEKSSLWAKEGAFDYAGEGEGTYRMGGFDLFCRLH